MANNALLYNAALNGYLAGALAGAPQSDPTQLDYKPIVDQAVVFATAMDAAIANDAVATPQPAGTPAISVAGGAVIYPAGATNVDEAQALNRLFSNHSVSEQLSKDSQQVLPLVTIQRSLRLSKPSTSKRSSRAFTRNHLRWGTD